MVCRNDEQCVLVRWNDETIYGFVTEPTEYQKKLLNAVNKLPTICRKVVILYAFEGMQRREIAAMMKTSLSAIRLLIYRSGLLLREHLNNSITQDAVLLDYEMKKVFCDWPYVEYAGLVELQKNIVVLG